MGTGRRAFLYLMRNKKKTMILLAVLTVIFALVLLCTAIGSAAGLSVQKLRGQMGGYFKIEPDFSQGKFGTVDDALVQKVKDAGGIKAVNGMDIQYFMTEDLELLPGRFTEEGDAKAKLTRFLGNTDSSRSEYFMLEYNSLTKGRHIEPKDSGKAVISDALAEKNNLSVGDDFLVRMNEENLPEEKKELAASHTLEIVGIYHVNSAQVYQSQNAAECDMEENFIFTDTAFIRKAYGEAAETELDRYTAGAAFFVENPKELDQIMGTVLEWEDYNWEDYAVIKNNKTYEDSAEPLEKLSGLVAMMAAVISVVSAVMLSLILFLWMRERVHEIGIYLSVGIQKKGLLGQYILESLLTAAAAFILALAIAFAASGVTGQMIGKSLSSEGEAEMSLERDQTEAAELKIRVGAAETAEVAGIGILIVLLSAGAASVTALRLQPKDILSKMS